MYRWIVSLDTLPAVEAAVRLAWLEALDRDSVGDWLQVGRDALRAHRTQIDPAGFWFKLPVDLVADAPDRVERGARVLEDHRHLAPAQFGGKILPDHRPDCLYKTGLAGMGA